MNKLRTTRLSAPLLAAAAIALMSNASQAADGAQIRIAGSSTVFPFVSAAAEQFGRAGTFKTPIVESTGTGGGFKLFCSGSGTSQPDIANASRPIKESEVALCKEHGVEQITEVPIGFDGIVIANAKGSPHVSLTKEQIFKALARKIPAEGKLVDNNHAKWSDIDPALPAKGIEVYGPPPTSGTRDAFVELVMEEVCTKLPEFAAAFPDEKQRKQQCGLLREDGKYIDAGEDDNVIVRKITSNPDALGIFGFSFLEENEKTVQGNPVDGVEPSFENILAGAYKVSRSLFVYVNNHRIGQTPGIVEFLTELTSAAAMGEEGYLADKGLIPLPPEALTAAQAKVAGLKK